MGEWPLRSSGALGGWSEPQPAKDHYVSIVCTLARDAEEWKKLRNTLRALMLASPLCEGRGLARALEDAFEVMYDHWELSVEIG